jgi:hypothetical protein
MSRLRAIAASCVVTSCIFILSWSTTVAARTKSQEGQVTRSIGQPSASPRNDKKGSGPKTTGTTTNPMRYDPHKNFKFR